MNIWFGACLTPACWPRPYGKIRRGIDVNSGAFHGEPFLASHEFRPSARNIEIDVRFVLQPVFGAFTTRIFHDVIAFQCGDIDFGPGT